MDKYADKLSALLDGKEIDADLKTQLETLVSESDTQAETLENDLHNTQKINLSLSQIVNQNVSTADDCIAAICGLSKKE